MKTIAVYTLTDRQTGKFYVGSTSELEKRMDRHRRDLRKGNHHCLPLQIAWNQRRWLIESYFPVETIEDARLLEQDIIDRYADTDVLLNVSLGTNGGDNLTRNPCRTEILEKIRKGVRERLIELTPLERRLIWGRPGEQNPMYGRRHTAEARARMSEASKGNQFASGTIRSEEHRKKLSEQAKLRTGDKNPFYGRTHSEETRQHLSEKAKAAVRQPANSRKVKVGTGIYASVTEAARSLNISPALVIYRLKSENPKYVGYVYHDECQTTIESTVGSNR